MTAPPLPKPPLGARPEWLWNELYPKPTRLDVVYRIGELEGAISRALAVGKEPDPMWVGELVRREVEGERRRRARRRLRVVWRLVGLLSAVACLVAAVRIYTGATTSVVPAWLAAVVGAAVLASSAVDLAAYWRKRPGQRPD